MELLCQHCENTKIYLFKIKYLFCILDVKWIPITDETYVLKIFPL